MGSVSTSYKSRSIERFRYYADQQDNARVPDSGDDEGSHGTTVAVVGSVEESGIGFRSRYRLDVTMIGV